MKELRQTIDMMTSDDYKERFKAEYYQTKIRYERLKKFNNKIEAAERMKMYGERMKMYGERMKLYGNKSLSEPPHDCPDDLLREQQSTMGEYLHLLEIRAEIENIEL